MKKENNIFNLFIPTRCIKKELEYNNKKFNVFVVKDSPAKCVGNRIILTNNFFNLKKEEQFAILYHEGYHKKFSTSFKHLLNIFRFGFIKARYEEEYCADSYAAKNAGKEGVLLFLKDGKKDYNKGIVKYNIKTHPPIEERIKRIKELKT